MVQRIESDLLIPGRGQPVRPGVVVLDGPVIAYAGASAAAPATPAATVTRAATVLPGLWDCHVHLLGLHRVAGPAFLESQQNMALSGYVVIKSFFPSPRSNNA